jgi:hypothetical protein
MDSLKDTPKGVGCPIRRSRDHRALAPPPSFSQRATSFIASRCQGIHQMPLSCSPTPSPKAAAQNSSQRSEASAGQRDPRRHHLASAHRAPPARPRDRCVSIAPTGATGPGVSAYPCPGTTDPPHKGPKVPAAHPVMPASRSRLASRCQNVHGAGRPARAALRRSLVRAARQDACWSPVLPLAPTPGGGPGPI